MWIRNFSVCRSILLSGICFNQKIEAKASAGFLIGNTDDQSSSNPNHSIVRFNEKTGTFSSFINSGSGGLDIPDNLTIGSDGSLFVSSGNYTNPSASAILRYDSRTGAPLGVFASGGGLSRPYGTTFAPGPNGKSYLYVSSFENDRILRYDAQTGAFFDTFALGGSGKSGDVNRPNGLRIGADGSLYVATEGTVAGQFPNSTISQVLRFSPNQLGQIGVQKPSVLVDQPTQQPFGYISFLGAANGKDGNLYVSDFANNIRVYDSSGNLIKTLSTNYTGTGATSNNTIGYLAFDDKGNLYTVGTDAANGEKGSVLRFANAAGGELQYTGTTYTSDQLTRPIGLVYVEDIPEPSVVGGTLLGVGIAALLHRKRRRLR